MPQRITCPRCGLNLSVSDRAPRHISCPRCLTPLLNPASTAPDVPTALAGPVPVLPLDRQVERDARLGRRLLVALLGLMAVAVLMALLTGDSRAAIFIVVLMVALWVVAVFTPGVRAAPATDPLAAYAHRPSTAGGPTVLEYGAPQRPARPTSAAAFAAGFFTGIGVCALGLFMLFGVAAVFERGGAVDRKLGSAVALAAVTAVVAGYIVLARRTAQRWPGFGPGATIGLTLGMLALGPCAACFVLSLV